MAIQRVVVERHLGVERQQRPVLGDDQRVDLDQRRVGRAERFPYRGHELGRGGNLWPLEPERKREVASLVRHQPDGGIDVLLENPVGRLFRDLLDLDAALGTGHQHGHLRGAVDDDAEVELALDLEPLLDQHPRHLLTARAGLVGDQVHADDLLGCRTRLVRVLDDLDAATLAAAARVNLRLDHRDAAAEPLGHARRVRGGLHHLAGGHGHAVLRQDRLRLILVNLHMDAALVPMPSSARRRALILSMM